MIMKREIRVLGIDDSPFDKFKDRYVIVIGAFFRGGNHMDGVVSTKISVDGNNSTKKLAAMVNSSRFKAQLKCLMIDGINMGGFNVIDIHGLYRLTKVPVIVVVRRKPDLPNIKRILARLGMSRKIALLDRAGAPFRCGKIYIQFAGISFDEAKEIVEITATHSYLPEPVRVAHLIGAGLAFGESKGNA
jgi:endonuclease V-like protein UPF0215 family